MLDQPDYHILAPVVPPNPKLILAFLDFESPLELRHDSESGG